MDMQTNKLVVLDNRVKVTAKAMMDAMEIAAGLSDRESADQILEVAQAEFGLALRRFYNARAEVMIR